MVFPLGGYMKKTIKTIFALCFMLLSLTIHPNYEVKAEDTRNEEENTELQVTEQEIMSVDQFRQYYNNGVDPRLRSTLVRVRRVSDIVGSSIHISIMEVDGMVVFCLDPTVSAGIGEEYTNEYTWWDIDWATRERIWYVIRFGYQQYGSDNYYIATQILIWRALGYYITPTVNVDSEIAQIEANINNYGYGVGPSFANGTFDVEYNVPFDLTDSNGVLGNYNVSCTPGTTCVANGNTLTITITSLNYQKPASISGVYGSYAGVDAGVVYVRPGSQSVMSIQFYDPPVSFRLQPRLLTGNLKVNKLDEFGLPAEAGQEFELAFDIDFINVIGTFNSTLGLLEINDLLPAGTYYIREINTTNPYTVNPTIYQFDIVLNETTEITIINDLREVELLQTKIDEDVGTLLLDGAVYEIKDITQATQVQALDPITGNPLWKDPAETIPVMEWQNAIYEITVITGNQYVRLYDPADHSQPLINVDVEFSLLSDMSVIELTLQTDNDGMINVSSSLLDKEETYYYRVVDTVNIPNINQVFSVYTRSTDDILGWANLPLKINRVYEKCEITPPPGYELNDNPCETFTLDLGTGITFREVTNTNKIRMLGIRLIKHSVNNTNMRLNGAVFQVSRFKEAWELALEPDTFDPITGDLIPKEPKVYIGEFITGALLIKDNAEGVNYNVYSSADKLLYDDLLSHAVDPLNPTLADIYPPTYTFTTDSNNEIIRRNLPDDTYFVQKEGELTFTEHYVQQGTIFIDGFRYFTDVEICEVTPPPGYRIDGNACHIVTIEANYGINIVENYKPNMFIIIPNMGDSNE